MFKGLSDFELPGSEEDQTSVWSTNSSEDTVSDVRFPPSSLLELFSQEELNDPLEISNFPKNLLNF